MSLVLAEMQRRRSEGVDLCDAFYTMVPMVVGNCELVLCLYLEELGDRGSTVVKVLCYKSEGRWFDPSWCHWIFH